MTTTPIYENQNFYAPRFEIKLRGQKVKQAVIRDVLEVSYQDSLEKLDSFEFTLHDWDPVLRLPKYSSPYDEKGELRKLEDNSPVPNFDPGAQVELRMGYYGPDEPRLMMTGQVVSLTPNFPASGTPTLRIRALDTLHTLEKSQETMVFENKTMSEIAKEIGSTLGITVEIPRGQKEQEIPFEYEAIENEYPITYLKRYAQRLGYDMYIKYPDNGGDPVLFFGKTPTSQVTYELEWGRSLAEFSPTVKTKGQVTKVVVRGWQPRAKGEKRKIEAVALWKDAGLDLPDLKLVAAIDTALNEFEDKVVNDPIESESQAQHEARRLLADKLKDLITGRGKTVGLPKMRAGQTIAIKGVGYRYSGSYVVTETTHRIGANGYTTDFSARMEGPLP